MARGGNYGIGAAAQRTGYGEKTKTATQRAQVHPRGPRLHTIHVQQHHNHDNRPAGQPHSVGKLRHRRLQRLAQVHRVRRSARGGRRRAQRHGTRRSASRSVRAGSRVRARSRDSRDSGRGHPSNVHPRRYAHPAQRLPPGQAAQNLAREAASWKSASCRARSKSAAC